MICIFEGPDGGGKSLLIREFNAATNYAHITIDRLHLSHMVFAQMMGRREYTNSTRREKAEDALKDFMRRTPAMIVYVKADAEVLKERIRRRGEDPGAGPDVAAAMVLYERLIKSLKLEKYVLTIDTTAEPGFDDLTARITKKIKVLTKEN